MPVLLTSKVGGITLPLVLPAHRVHTRPGFAGTIFTQLSCPISLLFPDETDGVSAHSVSPRPRNNLNVSKCRFRLPCFHSHTIIYFCDLIFHRYAGIVYATKEWASGS